VRAIEDQEAILHDPGNCDAGCDMSSLIIAVSNDNTSFPMATAFRRPGIAHAVVPIIRTMSPGAAQQDHNPLWACFQPVGRIGAEPIIRHLGDHDGGSRSAHGTVLRPPRCKLIAPASV
jgi:hypothetical protein